MSNVRDHRDDSEIGPLPAVYALVGVYVGVIALIVFVGLVF